MDKKRYDCVNCQRQFIASETATRVKCPNCNVLNIINNVSATGAVTPGYTPSVQSVPVYTLGEASRVAKEILYEDPSGPAWHKVDVNYEGIDWCYTKLYCLNKDKIEVFATKARATVKGVSANDIFNVFWDPGMERNWNSSSVSDVWILEDNGQDQLVFAQHKTTSAATSKNDSVYRRTKDMTGNNIWAYASAEKTPKKPEQSGWRRGYVVFSGFLIESTAPDSHQVTFVHCWDYNGLIHVKFVEEEQKRVALRLSKIRKLAMENAQRAHQPPPQMSNYTPTHQRISPRGEVVANSHSPSGGNTVNVCPACKQATNSKFCGQCGTPSAPACGKCLHPVPPNPSKFCGNCGNQLTF